MNKLFLIAFSLVLGFNSFSQDQVIMTINNKKRTLKGGANIC